MPGIAATWWSNRMAPLSPPAPIPSCNSRWWPPIEGAATAAIRALSPLILMEAAFLSRPSTPVSGAIAARPAHRAEKPMVAEPGGREPVRLLWLGRHPSFSGKTGTRVSFADSYPPLLISQASLEDLNLRSRCLAPDEPVSHQPGGERHLPLRGGWLEADPHRRGGVSGGQTVQPLHHDHGGGRHGSLQRPERAAGHPHPLPPWRGWGGLLARIWVA